MILVHSDLIRCYSLEWAGDSQSSLLWKLNLSVTTKWLALVYQPHPLLKSHVIFKTLYKTHTSDSIVPIVLTELRNAARIHSLVTRTHCSADLSL